MLEHKPFHLFVITIHFQPQSAVASLSPFSSHLRRRTVCLSVHSTLLSSKSPNNFAMIQRKTKVLQMDNFFVLWIMSSRISLFTFSSVKDKIVSFLLHIILVSLLMILCLSLDIPKNPLLVVPLYLFILHFQWTLSRPSCQSNPFLSQTFTYKHFLIHLQLNFSQHHYHHLN